MMVPASLSLLLAAVPGHARAQAIGTWSAIGALGAALGPVIGGFLVELSWRWVFWINIPVGVVTVISLSRCCRRVATRPRMRARTCWAPSSSRWRPARWRSRS